MRLSMAFKYIPDDICRNGEFLESQDLKTCNKSQLINELFHMKRHNSLYKVVEETDNWWLIYHECKTWGKETHFIAINKKDVETPAMRVDEIPINMLTTKPSLNKPQLFDLELLNNMKKIYDGNDHEKNDFTFLKEENSGYLILNERTNQKLLIQTANSYSTFFSLYADKKYFDSLRIPETITHIENGETWKYRLPTPYTRTTFFTRIENNENCVLSKILITLSFVRKIGNLKNIRKEKTEFRKNIKELEDDVIYFKIISKKLYTENNISVEYIVQITAEDFMSLNPNYIKDMYIKDDIIYIQI